MAKVVDIYALPLRRKDLPAYIRMSRAVGRIFRHLFIAGTGPGTPLEYSIPGRHVDETVVHDIAAWIRNPRVP